MNDIYIWLCFRDSGFGFGFWSGFGSCLRNIAWGCKGRQRNIVLSGLKRQTYSYFQANSYLLRATYFNKDWDLVLTFGACLFLLSFLVVDPVWKVYISIGRRLWRRVIRSRSSDSYIVADFKYLKVYFDFKVCEPKHYLIFVHTVSV